MAPVDRLEVGDTLVAAMPGRGMILGRRPLSLDCWKVDARGRAVCRVTTMVDGERIDVGGMLVGRGLAWHYRAFASERTAEELRALERAEAEARSARRGLWQAMGRCRP